jgi:lipopolysaccharide export LptBFGC system permease protein LptF
MTVLTRIDVDGVHHFCRNRGMMRTRIAVVIVALSVIATGACFAANAQLGTWKLNEAKSKIAPGMGKNTTVVYTEQKDKIKVTVEGVGKDGKPTHGVWVGKFDGKTYPEKGNMPFDAIAYKVVNDRTNDLTAMKNGKALWTSTITVAKDGKSRTVVVNGTDEKGKKFTSKAVYDKQ